MNRQHHCRKCGTAICDECSQCKQPLPELAYYQEVRICRNCHESIELDKRKNMLGSRGINQTASKSVRFMDSQIQGNSMLSQITPTGNQNMPIGSSKSFNLPKASMGDGPQSAINYNSNKSQNQYRTNSYTTMGPQGVPVI